MRTKRNPLNEGSLMEISNFLIKPSIRRSLNPEWTWQIDQVAIERYITLKPFKMPGLFYVAGAVKVQGIGYREVGSNTTLWVRTDKRSDLIDVEFNGGQGAAEQVFGLTASEWAIVQRNIIIVDKH